MLPHNKRNYLQALLISSIVCIQCSKEKDKNCTPRTITAIATASLPCSPTGTITVSLPLGGNFNYDIDHKGLFQSNPGFIGVSSGKHVIIANNEKDCMDSINIDVPLKTTGPFFSSVKALLAANCVRCHGELNPQAG